MSTKKSIVPRMSLVPFATIDWRDLSPIDLDVTEDLELAEMPDVSGFLAPIDI